MAILSPPFLSIPLILDPYGGPIDDPSPREGGWVAAVSVILRPTPQGAELLLIRRATHAEDPWSGHMALPGGRRDPTDPHLLHTAERETWEEVAIRLHGQARLLGKLGVVAPRNPGLPPLTILPLVFAVSSETEARRAAPEEVAELHWVSLDHFRAPENRTRVPVPGATGLTFPAFDVAGRMVWGLTHRVLTDLLGRVGG
jgi:8-oxo-dGTP pyrophosphatase MutT (NUDIX family)